MLCKCKNCNYPNAHTTAGHICGNCKKAGHGAVECNNENAKKLLIPFYNEQMPKELWCTVQECRFPWSHSISSHRFIKKNNNNIKYLQIKCPICTLDNKVPHDQEIIKGLEEQCKVCFDSECHVLLPQCFHVCLCANCANKLNTNNNVTLTKFKNITKIKSNDMIDNNIINEYSDDFSKNFLYQGNKLFGEVKGKIYTIINAGMGNNVYVRRDDIIDSVPQQLKGYFMHNDNWGQYSENTNDRPKLEKFLDGYKVLK
jgi:hypothetical protein